MIQAHDTLDILRKKNRDDPKWITWDLDRLLFNPRLHILAYERLKSKPGNLTSGSDHTTLDVSKGSHYICRHQSQANSGVLSMSSGHPPREIRWDGSVPERGTEARLGFWNLRRLHARARWIRPLSSGEPR
jgi:hypothetical protein